MQNQEILINEEQSLIDVMNLLDKLATKVLFVVKNNKFIASVTDGDIRRFILKNGNLDAKVRDFANYHPKFLFKNKKSQAKKYLRENSLKALPILDQNKNILEIIFLNDKNIDCYKKNINIPVVIMAGGLGTRLYPYTKVLPKPLIPVGDIPIVEHIINRFNNQGCDDFYLIVNHKKNMIKAYFNEIKKSYNINYIDENEPLGTGGGLSLLKNKINKTFVLTNCDILVDEDFSNILKFHRKNKNIITMICSLKNFKIPYGVIEFSDDGVIKNIKEKPEMSFFTNTGCYIVEPEIIDNLEDNKKIGFPDIVKKYKENNQKVGIYPISENAWLDMGQVDELEKMKQRLNIYE